MGYCYCVQTIKKACLPSFWESWYSKHLAQLYLFETKSARKCASESVLWVFQYWDYETLKFTCFSKFPTLSSIPIVQRAFMAALGQLSSISIWDPCAPGNLVPYSLPLPPWPGQLLTKPDELACAILGRHRDCFRGARWTKPFSQNRKPGSLFGMLGLSLEPLVKHDLRSCW